MRVIAKTNEKEKRVRKGERFSFSLVFFSYYCFHFLFLFFLFIAGEPYASQHTILYNIGEKPKFVGCKIRSMCSRVVFFCVMTSRKTHMDEIERFQENFKGFSLLYITNTQK